MKVSASEIRHGPFRWLFRICSWYMLIGGIANLFIQSDMLTIYLGGEGIGTVLAGAFCVFLDFLLSATDPQKAARKKSKAARASSVNVSRSNSARSTPSAADDVEKTYREILNLLPTDSNLPRLISQYGRDELIRQVKQDENFCHQIFMRTLSRDVLDFIHTHNLIASYKIILELLKGAQKKQQEEQAARSGNSFGGNSGSGSSQSGSRRGENHINSFDKYTK